MYSVEKNVKPLKNILTLNKIEIVPTTVISGLLNILEPFSITFVLLTIEMLGYLPCYPAEKKKQNPAQNTLENVMDLMVVMGIVLF